jgi:hypothetical protein
VLEVSNCEWQMHVPLPHCTSECADVTACLRECLIDSSDRLIVADRTTLSHTKWTLRRHKLTAKLEAAERAAERAALEKSRLQNDPRSSKAQGAAGGPRHRGAAARAPAHGSGAHGGASPAAWHQRGQPAVRGAGGEHEACEPGRGRGGGRAEAARASAGWVRRSCVAIWRS